jgi:hypothetical protein
MDVEVDTKNPTDAAALVQIMIEKDEIDIDDMEEAGYDEPEIYIVKRARDGSDMVDEA